MSKLVTQTTEEKPQVLLVAFESWLSRELVRFISNSDLEVVQISPDEVTATFLDQNLFYKIIFLGGWSPQFEQLKTVSLEKIANLLGHKSQVVGVFPVSTLELENKTTRFWNLPKIILGQDVVPPQSNTWPVFSFITRDIGLGFLVDPQLELFLQSETAFLTQLKAQLLSPTNESLVIRGKKQISLSIVKEIQRQFNQIFNQNLQIKTLNKKQSTLSSSLTLVEAQAEDIPTLVAASVRMGLVKTKPPVLPQTKTHATLLKSQPQVTKPAPVIQPKPKLKTEVKPEIIETKPDPEVEIDQQLQQIFKEKRVEHKVDQVKKVAQTTHQHLSKNKRRKKSFWVGVIVTSLAVVFLVLASIFKYSEFLLVRELMHLSADWSQTESDLRQLERSSQRLGWQLSLYSHLLPPEFLEKSHLVYEIGQDLPQIALNLEDLSQELAQTTQYFWGNVNILDPASDLKSDTKLKDTYSLVSQAFSRLEEIKTTLKGNSEQDEVQQLSSQLDETRQKLIVAQQIKPIEDLLLGNSGKKRIAIVLQNNHELRATGGFLQAVAILTVDRGMVIDTEVKSSYELDQMLAGEVIPPDDVITLLGENKWYLRDSNWDPNFEDSGRQIAWFLQEESNQPIDLVVATNLFALEDFIKAVGPLDVPEFNEVITEKNLLERAEYHSEIKLVDGDAKVDYLSLILEKMILKLRGLDQERALALMNQVYQSLENKQTLLYSGDQTVEKTLADLNWSGSLVQPECPSQLATQPCQVDALAVVDSNIGVNKANYHTDREETHLVQIGSDSVTHTRTIIFKNTAQVNAWPKGEYRSYLRFYLPLSAQEMTLQVNGQDADPATYQVKKTGQANEVGLLTVTPIKSQTQIELSYTLPLEIDPSKSFSYAFFNQAQPGTKDVLQEVDFSYDSTLSPTLIAPQAVVKDNQVIFTPDSQDHFFGGITFDVK